MNCPHSRGSTYQAPARSRPVSGMSLHAGARSLHHQAEIETIGNAVERELVEVDFVAGAERADHSEVRKIGEHLCGGDGVMRRGGLGNDDIVGLRQTRKAGRDIGASRGISDVICIEILTCGGGVSRAQFPGLGRLCVPDLEAVVWEAGDSTRRALHRRRPIDVVTDIRRQARQQAARLEHLETEKRPGTGSHPLGGAPVSNSRQERDRLEIA